MKKLLYIPLNYETKPYKYWYEAFCKHFDCRYYTNLSDAVKFKPDHVFIHSGALTNEELHMLWGNLDTFIIQWCGDCRNELLPEVIRTGRYCKLTFLASGIAQKEMYEKALCHPVKYLQHAVSNIHYPVKENLTDKKIVFIGNNYSQFPGAVERSELCAILSKEFPDNFEVYGSGWDSEIYNNCHPLDWKQKLQKYNSAYISISSNIYNDKEGYWSDRPLEIMAAGSCCLMAYVPNLQNYFQLGKDLIPYPSNEHALVAIRSLLTNEKWRNEIAQHGQNTVLAHHTYDNRVEEILNAIQ